MYRRVVIMMGLLLSPFFLQAENLLEIYELAKRNDPAYAAAVAQYHAAKEASPKARAEILPQVNFASSTARTIFPVSDSNSISDYTTNIYSLRLNQTLYNKAQFDAIDQADVLVAQANADYGNAKQDLIIRVAQRYLDVLSESANLVFANAEKKAIDQQLNQAKQRFKVGLTAITDVHEAQARYDQSVSQEIETQRLYDISQESLREIIGVAHNSLNKFDHSRVLISPEPSDIEAWVKTALNNNLQLLSAKNAMLAASKGRELARAGHYPTLGFEAGYSSFNQAGGAFRNSRRGAELKFVLNVPIYSGGGTTANNREAAANYQRSKQLYEQQRRTTVKQTRNSYLTVLSTISQVKALKQALRSTKTALEATKAGFEVGTRTAVDVLDSQREMFRAQRDYIRARHDYIVNTLQLKQAAGILADENIRLINAWVKS